ncbi:helix-turn-helix domain-containing protein [Methylobacterium oryzihabitans]|uniref:helix-turn-helix domain-containing protein n=1 Tax=Methylobacterium oryzihabitans TaxID=2499852 RepID=UPI0016523B3E|nr:helix-turn-helix transcriptional regulator [Methylobacterium oryzihabitans]
MQHGRPAMGNNLKQLRQRRGWTMELAASAMGLSAKGYEKIERGERRLTADRITRAAEVFQVPEVDVIGARNPVRVVGQVARGGLVTLYDGNREEFEVAPRPDDATLATVSLVVADGDALPCVAEEDWLIYHDEEKVGVPEEWIGALCHVCTTDGALRIRRIFHGREPELYDLFGTGYEPVRNADVVWTSKITWIKPR